MSLSKRAGRVGRVETFLCSFSSNMSEIPKQALVAGADFSAVALTGPFDGNFTNGRRGWRWIREGVQYSIETSVMGFDGFNIDTSSTAAAHCVASFLWFKGAGFGAKPRPALPGTTFGPLTKRPIFQRPPAAGAAKNVVFACVTAYLAAAETSFDYANKSLLHQFLTVLSQQEGHVLPAGVKLVSEILWQIYRCFVSGRSAHLIHVVGAYANSEGASFFTLQTLTTALLKNRRTKSAFDNHIQAQQANVEKLSEVSSNDAGDLITNWSEDLSTAAVARYPTVGVPRIRAIVYGSVQQAVRGNMHNLIDVSAYVDQELIALLLAPIDAAETCRTEHGAAIADLRRRLRDTEEQLATANVRVQAAAEREADYIAEIADVRQNLEHAVGAVSWFTPRWIVSLKTKLVATVSYFSFLNPFK